MDYRRPRPPGGRGPDSGRGRWNVSVNYGVLFANVVPEIVTVEVPSW